MNNLKKIIYKITPPQLLRFYLIHSQGKSLKVYSSEKNFGEAIEYAFETFMTQDERKDNHLLHKIEKDIIRCFILYSTTPNEYFLYGFNSINTSHAKRRTFVTDYLKDHTLIKKEGWNNYLELSNKYSFYKKLKPFYHREIVELTKETTIIEFIQFAKEHQKLFIKPNFESYGNGAKLFDYVNDEEAETFFHSLFQEGDNWIVEERIFQSPKMSVWNDTSVNTIRVNSYLTKKSFHILGSFMRSGRKGFVVDNGGSGGIFASVDDKTGVIISNGANEYGNEFTKHPDSGYTYKGTQIPQWNELISIVEQAHRTIPHHIYVSWDFALTNSGWSLIEGNWGQFVAQQTSSKKGLKKMFLKYMNEGRLSPIYTLKK